MSADGFATLPDFRATMFMKASGGAGWLGNAWKPSLRRICWQTRLRSNSLG